MKCHELTTLGLLLVEKLEGIVDFPCTAVNVTVDARGCVGSGKDGGDEWHADLAEQAVVLGEDVSAVTELFVQLVKVEYEQDHLEVLVLDGGQQELA